ncbi:GATA zinc finger domain-containing protein, partial [Lachnellula suecica]
HAQYAPSQARRKSPPQPLHPHPIPFSRPEPTANNFSEVPRHPSLASLQTAPAPQNPYAGRYEPPRFEQNNRVPDRLTNGYTHVAPPPPASYVYGPGPGQNPVPGPQSPAYAQPRYPPREVNEIFKGGREAERFKQGLKRSLEEWDFENYLSSINVSSGALQAWSMHFHSIAQEQQPRDPNGVPDRMPTLESCNDMLQLQDKIRMDLEKLRDMISQEHENAALMDQRMREHGGKGPGYYEDEMSMYGEDMKSQGYGGPESKKRRGRAAPPGRCHSCNRAETPEWRRGPDGARTLCNACGLHYAKLTRKNTMKQSQSSNGSSLRPKSMDDVSPRPL